MSSLVLQVDKVRKISWPRVKKGDLVSDKASIFQNNNGLAFIVTDIKKIEDAWGENTYFNVKISTINSRGKISGPHHTIHSINYTHWFHLSKGFYLLRNHYRTDIFA